MPIYQRDPYRNEMAGTIADLILRQGQARAGGERQVADIQARGALQQGQNRAQLIGTIGDLAARGVAGYFESQQRERELAPRREMEQQQIEIGRRELAAGDALTQRREALAQLFRRPEPPTTDEVLAIAGPEDGPKILAGFKALEAAERKDFSDRRAVVRDALVGLAVPSISDELRAQSYPTVRNHLVKAGVIGPDDAPEAYDPGWFASAVRWGQSYKEPEAVTLSPGQTRFGPDGKAIASLPAEPKVDTRSIGTLLADAARRGDRAEYNRLLQTVKDQATAGRDPNAGRTNEPLVAVIGDNGEPVLMPRSQASGRKPASNREQGRAVTAGSASMLAELQTSLDDTNVLREQLGRTGAGSKIGAILPNVVSEVTGWGADSKSRQAVIDRVKQVIGKALEGGVLRKEDERKYEKILPTIGDPPQVAKAKLDGLEKALVLRRERLLESLDDAGYDIGQFKARAGAKAIEDPLGIR